MERPGSGTPIAAVDLGSNSFHMMVAAPVDGHLHVMDRLRDMVRLAAGLDENNILSEEARTRALDCLERFGQRLREMPQGSVRAVGTNTLRKARGAGAFIVEAERALGHPIEVISGVEEARLIYLGVAHALARSDTPRLVIDIGGGSTELIVGTGFEPRFMESLYMGCVGASRRHFPDGVFTADRFERAVLAARVELEPVAALIRGMGWREAIGASGTVKAVAAMVQAEGWSGEGIERASMDRLRDAMLAAGDLSRLKLKGLKPERVPVLAGGFAVLYALFEDLGIERLGVSEWALREGLLFDQLGRIRHEDVRERTIAAMCARYHVERAQADRVHATAAGLLQQVAAAWRLEDEDSVHLLAWAARLHEVGLAIAHAQYHKHGAYIIANADMPGFSHQEQQRLAALVRGHRRKFPQAIFKELPASTKTISRLCLLLRLSVLLHRSRTDVAAPSVMLLPEKNRLTVRFADDWLAMHPLTRADLDEEVGYLAAAGFELLIESVGRDSIRST